LGVLLDKAPHESTHGLDVRIVRQPRGLEGRGSLVVEVDAAHDPLAQCPHRSRRVLHRDRIPSRERIDTSKDHYCVTSVDEVLSPYLVSLPWLKPIPPASR